MSVIQDALKKAQQQRTQKKSETPYGNATPKNSNALMYIAVGALCCTIVIVILVVFSSPAKRRSPTGVPKAIESKAAVASAAVDSKPLLPAAQPLATEKLNDKKKRPDGAIVSRVPPTGKTQSKRLPTAQTEPSSEPIEKSNVSPKVLNSDTLYNEAVMLQRAGRLTEAKTLYQKVLSIQPNHIESLNNLGIIANQSGDSREAVAYFGKALEYNKNYSKAYNNIGLISMKEGNRQLAEEYFSKAISLEPADPEPYVNLSALLKSQNKFREAERILKEAMHRRLEDSSITLSYAIIKDSLGESEEAAIYYRKYLSSIRNPASMKSIIERLQYIEQNKTTK
ncbi:MAG TPA: tetratricopeptide repeat protein [Syntrophorhabdaceae bacterium]|nr:tetratricopeptide repeat protein [Syntrophorhabdaceae bacterium]